MGEKNVGIFDTDLAKANKAAVQDGINRATAGVVGAAKATKPATEALHATVKGWGKGPIVLGLLIICVVLAAAGVMVN